MGNGGEGKKLLIAQVSSFLSLFTTDVDSSSQFLAVDANITAGSPSRLKHIN